MENQKSAEHWPKMDLTYGQVKSYFSLTKNDIYTQQYSYNATIFLSILNSFINPSSVSLYSTLLSIFFFNQASALSIPTYFAWLILVILASIIKRLLIIKAKSQADSRINKRTAKVYRGNQLLQKLQWGQIQQGDIVYLVQGESAPADMIILDSQQIQHRQAITYVDVKNLSGQSTCQKKKACYLTQLLNRSSTQKRVWQQYRKILTGRITYQKPTSQMNKFTGYLKLAKDPKVQKISIQNLILRQSTIKTSLWIYGLVIYPGMDSKVMKSFKQGNRSRQHIFSETDKLFLMMVLIGLILSNLFGHIYYLVGNSQYHYMLILAFHYIIFSVMAPHFIYLSTDLFLILLKVTKNTNDLQFRQYNNLSQLGQVTHAIMSNVGVITTGKLQVNEIVTQSSIYTFGSEEMPVQNIEGNKLSGIHKKRRLGSSIRAQHPQGAKQIQNKFLLPIMNYDKRASALVFKEGDGFMENENFQIDDDTNFRLKQSPLISPKSSKLNTHLEPLRLDKNRFYNYVKRNENQSTDIIKAFGLCHQAKFHYQSSKDKYIGISNVNSEQVLLKLVNYVGWNIMPKMIDKKEVGITIFEQKQKMDDEKGLFTFQTIKNTYYWTGINSFHIPRRLFSVFVSHNEKHTLYCKGKAQDIIQRLKVSKQTQKIIQQTILSYNKKQSEVIIYAKRELSDQQKQIYQNDYVSLKSSLTTSEQQIEQFSKRYEKNLQFICIIGMSTQINSQATSLIKYLRTSGIKPCICVNQKSETASIKKLAMQDNQSCQDFELESQSAQLIKYYLNQATNLYSNSQFKYNLIVSGKAWQVIKSNSEVLQHFMFVLHFSQALIAIKFSSENIGDLANKIRSSYPDKNTVLAIGYSYDDLKFLGQSNLSISTSQDLPTDIKVQNLNKIIQVLKIGPYLLMVKLFKWSLILYRTISISTVVFAYQTIMMWYHTTQTINGHLVFIYAIINNLLQIIYNLYSFRNPTKLQDSTKYKEFKNVRRKFYVDYLQGFLHGIVITYSLFFNLSGAKHNNSKVYPMQALDLAIFIALSLAGCLRNLFNLSFNKAKFIVTTIITLLTLSLSLFLTSLLNTKFQRVYSQLFILWENYDSIISILNSVMFCIAISLFLQEIVKKKLLNQKQQNKVPQLHKKQLKNKMIEIIKYLYKQQSNMQFSLQQIVSTQLDVNQLKINKYLQIKDEEQDVKFLSQRISNNRKNLIKLCIVLIAQFLTFFIVDITFESNGFSARQISCIIGLVFFICSLILLLIKHQTNMCIYNFMYIFYVIFTCLTLAYTYQSFQNHDYLISCVLAVAITQNININFFLLVFLMLVMIISGIVVSLVNSSQLLLNKLFFPILTIICMIYNFYQFYEVDKSTRITFVKTESFEKQSNYVNGILSILVPKFIKNHLEGNELDLQQQQKKVSILFCYICQFDEIVRQQGTNVVSLMDQLFRQFDQLCHNYAVQKIETVGQTYMAATGIQAYEDEIESQMKKKNQVERLLKMAIQMLQKSKDIMWGIKKNKKINLKIGIHHGNVMIGVIGYHKPQFSLIGDAVNTTSRHCSTASPGQIVVSAVAYQLLRKFPASAFTKSTKTMKGLGQVPVYKYNNNIRKQQSHFRMRIKFQNAVKKVIQILKSENKINYKKFKASQIAAKVMLRQRLSTKKATKLSQPRRSLAQHPIIPIQNLLNPPTTSKQNKYNEKCIKYNKFMELEDKSINFKKDLILKHQKGDKLKIILLAFIYLLSYLVVFITMEYTKQSLALTSIGIPLFPIMFLLYKKSIKHKRFKIAFVIIHCYLIIISNLNSIQIPVTDKQNPVLRHIGDYYGLMAVTICCSQKSFRFIDSIIFAIVSLGVSSTVLGFEGNFDSSIVAHIFFLILTLIRKYSYLQEYYESYNHAQIYEKKMQQQSALVSQLLPKHAYEKLKNQNIENKLQLTDRFQYATILFADIKGFTSYSNKNTPAGVVKMLRQLFQQFDKLCLKFNVYKVYTIGDCYVVLGFTNCYQRDYLQEAKNVVNMGLAMVQTIQRVRQALDFQQLDMRIGIHTGTLIGGIIGTEIVRYDIYGPDVMVANKFQQHGKTGNIHISEATKQILDQDKKKSFNIVPHGVVRVEKLNAEYNGYILTKKKFQL